MYDLPTSVTVGGVEYEIRSDYRAVLDICTALSDPELSDQERALVALEIFYPALEDMPPSHYEEAIKKCFWFVSCGDENKENSGPRLVDWEKDFKFIAAPVNRILTCPQCMFQLVVEKALGFAVVAEALECA
jgi:hypothetical protein